MLQGSGTSTELKWEMYGDDEDDLTPSRSIHSATSPSFRSLETGEVSPCTPSVLLDLRHHPLA